MPDRSVDAHTRWKTPGAGARATLRAPRSADIARLVALAGDPEVARHLERLPHPYEEVHARTWLTDLERARGREVAFALDDGTGLIGVISFRTLDETPEIGYWLGLRYWGQGIMSEAARLALGRLFETTPASAVTARVSGSNPASLAVLTNTGFRVAEPARAGGTTVGLRLDRADHFRLHDHMNGTAADRAAQKATQR